jgi:V8-like Glu-specific endopeptidase
MPPSPLTLALRHACTLVVVFPRRLVALAAVVLVGLGVPAVAMAIHLRASTKAHPAAQRIPTSHTTNGVRQVGALFPTASSANHECTATVVNGSHGDVLLTAAHCVPGSGAGMVFAPGFHDGISPDGRWTVTAAHLAPAWLRSQDPHDDFAFLTVAPQAIHGRVTEIQQVTGAYTVGNEPQSGQAITVLGYPEVSNKGPRTCQTKVYFTDGFPSFDCRGYVAGTSGGPWLVRTSSGTRVVGIIGGRNEGGCVDSSSYSSPLTQAARRAYVKASEHDPADVAPPPPGDGCS